MAELLLTSFSPVFVVSFMLVVHIYTVHVHSIMYIV